MAIKDTIKNASIALLQDLIVFGFLKGKDGKEGKVLKPEEAGKIIKTLAPHFFGIGPEDEAIFNAALAKLEYGMNVDIARFLKKLSARERARFIMSVAVIPNETDRMNVLKMYGNLQTNEMILVAKNSRMIGGDGISKHVASVLKQSGLDQNAGKIASEIARKNKKFKQRKDNPLIKFRGVSIRRHRLIPAITIPKFKLYK